MKNDKVRDLYRQLQAARGDQQRYEQLFDLFIKAQDASWIAEQASDIHFNINATPAEQSRELLRRIQEHFGLDQAHAGKMLLSYVKSVFPALTRRIREAR